MSLIHGKAKSSFSIFEKLPLRKSVMDVFKLIALGWVNTKRHVYRPSLGVDGTCRHNCSFRYVNAACPGGDNILFREVRRG